MAVAEQPDPAAGKPRPVAVAPWVAAALIPVGFVWGVYLSLDAYFGVPDPNWLLYKNLLILAPTTAAVSLAIRAVHAGHRTGRGALMVSGSLLVAIFAFAGLDVVWIITSAAVIVGLGLLGWLAGRKPVAPTDDAVAPESGHEAPVSH